MNTDDKIIAAYRALGGGRVTEGALVAKTQEMFPGTTQGDVLEYLGHMEACEEARVWHDATWTIEVTL